MHNYDIPTVEFSVDLYTRCADTGTWRWVPCTVQSPSRDHIYSKRELCLATVGYGVAASRAIPPAKVIRYRVLARGLVTGLMLADYEWYWDRDSQRYTPVADPWVVWPKVESLPPETRRRVRQLGIVEEDMCCKWCA